MGDLAIRTERLGKRYNIGQHRNIRTLSETLNDYVARLLRRNHVVRPAATKPFWALRDITFQVDHGEVLGIIGRNGSGKSTLLKILSRITRPTEGSLEVRGRIRPLLEVGVGFHPELTGRENIYLNGSLMGMKRAEIDRRFDEIVEFSGIPDFIDTPVKFYSSGMYVRLAFAASVHLEPDIMLIDEVLAVGDVEFQKKCLKKIDQIRSQGRTILLVSHNVMQLAELSSHVIWLDAGRLIEQGDPRTVASNYLASGQVSASVLPSESGKTSEKRGTTAVPIGCVDFDPPHGSDGVTVRRTYVTDDQSNIISLSPYEKPFCLVAEYEVESTVPGLRIGFKLYNERDQVVIHTVTNDSTSPDGKIVGPEGRHRAAVQIPGAWFTPGRYYVELGVWSPRVGHHFLKSNVFQFDIGAAPLDSIGYEVLRPMLDWELGAIHREPQIRQH